jgi:hypothetical protein
MTAAAIKERKMANDDLVNLLGWVRQSRERLQMQREMLQSGKFKIVRDEGSGPVDVSSEKITTPILPLDPSPSINSMLRMTIRRPFAVNAAPRLTPFRESTRGL